MELLNEPILNFCFSVYPFAYQIINVANDCTFPPDAVLPDERSWEGNLRVGCLLRMLFLYWQLIGYRSSNVGAR